MYIYLAHTTGHENFDVAGAAAITTTSISTTMQEIGDNIRQRVKQG